MKCLLICIAICIISPSSLGQSESTKAKSEVKQTPKSTAPEKGIDKGKEPSKAESDTEAELSLVRRRALDLLRQAGDEASNISDGRQAARLQSKAADLLWDHDRETAQKFFESAFDIAIRYYRDNKPAGMSVRNGPPPMPGSDARMAIINIAGRRDSALGRRFTDQYIEEKLREQKENAQKSGGSNNGISQAYGSVDPIAQDLLTTADMLYQSDPKTALELAQRAFLSGVPPTAPNFLGKLAENDRPAADGLFLFALNKISNDESLPVVQLLRLSAYPFGENRVWTIPGYPPGFSFAGPKNFVIDARLIQQFFAVSAAVLSGTGDLNPTSSPDAAARIRMALFAAGILRPKIVRFQPEQIGPWDALTSKLTTALTPQMAEGIGKDLQNIEQAKTPDASTKAADQTGNLLDQIDKASDVVNKDVLYQQAAVEADRRGDTKRGLAIADKIADGEYRDQTKHWIYFEAATRAIRNKQYDDARLYATMVNEMDQSAWLFCQIAEAAVKDKDHARAAQLLDETLHRMSSATDSVKKINVLLGIANVYSSFDIVRGFEVTAEAVRAANKVRDYGIEQNSVSRNLNANGRFGMGTVSVVAGFDITATLILLGRADFDRSLLLAQSLENKLVRINSVIAVAASVLQTGKPATGR